MISKYKRFLTPEGKEEFSEKLTEQEFRKYVDNQFHNFDMETFESNPGHREKLTFIKECPEFFERIGACNTLNYSLDKKAEEKVEEMLRPISNILNSIRNILINRYRKDYMVFQAKPEISEES